jgi:hypothetical protein
MKAPVSLAHTGLVTLRPAARKAAARIFTVLLLFDML